MATDCCGDGRLVRSDAFFHHHDTRSSNYCKNLLALLYQSKTSNQFILYPDLLLLPTTRHELRDFQSFFRLVAPSIASRQRSSAASDLMGQNSAKLLSLHLLVERLGLDSTSRGTLGRVISGLSAYMLPSQAQEEVQGRLSTPGDSLASSQTATIPSPCFILPHPMPCLTSSQHIERRDF